MIRDGIRRFALRAIVATCGMGSTSTAAGAQLTPGLQVLDVPSGQSLECSIPTAGTGGGRSQALAALVRRRFVIPRIAGADLPGLPPLPERELQVMWDSAGRPQVLSDFATPRLRDGTTVVATFRPDGSVRGRHVLIAIDSARVEEVIRSRDPAGAHAPGVVHPPVSRDLTPEEGMRARALAEWLWPRRCRAAT